MPVSELTQIDNELLVVLEPSWENCLRVCLSQAWGVQAADTCSGLYREIGSSQMRTESFQFIESSWLQEMVASILELSP